MAHLLTLYSQSKYSDLQQRCLEFLQLAREGPAAMAAVLPVDASCEDVEVRRPSNRQGEGSTQVGAEIGTMYHVELRIRATCTIFVLSWMVGLLTVTYVCSPQF